MKLTGKRGDPMRRCQDARILLVDDESELLELVAQALRGAGYTRLILAETAAQARAAFSSFSPDFVVLDVNLPDGDGFSLFQALRAQTDVPVLFLSARDADADRLFGLGLGADDYLTKPFLMQELLLRIALILRRTYRDDSAQDAPLHLGSATVDWAAAAVTSPSGTCALTATECRLLRKLAENRGRIVTFDALCECVWGAGYYGYENSLNVHIRHLREKLEESPSHPRYLLTARGLGYRLAPEEA